MRVIGVENVSKQFRMQAAIPHTTLKTTFVNLVLGRNQPIREPGLHVLKDVSLTVQQGQTVGIIGRNGSGKSTLLKLLAKILQPDSGKIEVNGKVAALLELGAGFHPEFTGRENVLVNGIVLGLTKKEVKRRFPAIVRFAEMEPFIDEPVRTYSSGMYMRLGFAVAVHTDPDVLLIDEVLAVGDELFQKKCSEKISEFQRKGKTIVLVTHDLSAVERWCHEVIWLDEGLVRRRGTPKEVIECYLETIDGGEASVEEPDRELSPTLSVPPSQLPIPDDVGEEHSDERGGEGREGRRWGGMEVEIVSVRLLDRYNQERSLYRSGEGMKVEICYQVREKVEEAVFGFAVIREDGLWCYGTNTQIEKIVVPQLGHTGILEIVMEHLNLIGGQYYLDVAVHRENGTPYDYHTHLYPFSISSEIKDVGVARIPHQWIIQPGT